jgi:Tfp pilus assembly pilus retraction ATPase PilT
MSLMPSLCAALERAGGERLVMRAGERPHVLAGARRQDVASAVLSINAVEALAEQILSGAGRQELSTHGVVSEPVLSSSFPHPLTARAERVGDDFSIELIVSLPDSAPGVLQKAEEPAPAVPVVEHPPVIATSEPALMTSEPFVTSEPVIVAAEPEPEIVTAPPIEVASTPDVRIDVRAYAPPEPVRRAERPAEIRSAEPVRQSRSRAEPPQDLAAWIRRAADLGATMLFLRAGSTAAARIDDRIQPVSDEIIDASVVDEIANAFSRGGDGRWQPRPDGEWVREDEEFGYVSCRVFSDLDGAGLVVQLRPTTSLRLLHKHIPRQVRLACEGQGLVVVTAGNEADVETMAAAVADWSSRDRGGYLISLQRRSRSLEDIAGVFVSRRTIGGSEKDFAAAIRRAAQEAPDILLVTGLQSEQALQSAVLAAAGGRLVIVGVVASTTVDALRMLSGSDVHVRRAMAASFRAAIGYRSLRRIGGGRTLVQDVVLATGAVCGALEGGDFDRLARMQQDGGPGMRSVDESLARAVARRHVALREAAAQASDRSLMVSLVRSMARRRAS